MCSPAVGSLILHGGVVVAKIRLQGRNLLFFTLNVNVCKGYKSDALGAQTTDSTDHDTLNLCVYRESILTCE